MIPKIIHYCWFGRNPKPKLAAKCIKSWKKKCPDYQIIEWNEDNFDLAAMPLYVRQAYDAKKWAFVTDYVRLKLVYDYGGIYLDTDVEVIKRFDSLLKHKAFFGFEGKEYIATGLGFGAEKGSPILYEMMADYVDIPFILPDGTYDNLPCPQRNTKILYRQGLIANGESQTLLGDISILSAEYMCPMDYTTGILHKTENTISIHWFSASWQSAEEKQRRNKMVNEIKRNNRIHYWKTIPNRALMRVLGEKQYETLKRKLKRG